MVSDNIIKQVTSDSREVIPSNVITGGAESSRINPVVAKEEGKAPLMGAVSSGADVQQLAINKMLESRPDLYSNKMLNLFGVNKPIEMSPTDLKPADVLAQDSVLAWKDGDVYKASWYPYGANQVYVSDKPLAGIDYEVSPQVAVDKIVTVMINRLEGDNTDNRIVRFESGSVPTVSNRIRPMKYGGGINRRDRIRGISLGETR